MSPITRAAASALLASACAVVTGLDGYRVDGEAAPSTSSSSGALPDAGFAADVVVPVTDGGSLPPTCTAGQVACTGTIANTCVDGAWEATPCEQTCKDGVCDVYPSCRSATGSGCGASALSCCASRPVPGGTFNRRNDTTLPATIGAFELDVFEVTVGRFRAFLEAGGATQASPPVPGSGAHPKLAGSGWHVEWNQRLAIDVATFKPQFKKDKSTWTDAPEGNEHLPIDNVTWLEAFAFCAWDGGRLPTYAELGFAATGGSEQRFYPWSSPPDRKTLSNLPAVEAAFDCNFKAPARSCSTTCTGCGLEDIAPVGSLPAGAGKWGQLDLAGNVAEWTLDLSDPPSEARPPPVCNDCAVFLTTDPEKAVIADKQFRAEFYALGGAWDGPANDLTTSRWEHHRYDDRRDTQGFRCARDAR